MTPLDKDDTEYGVLYVRKSEADAAISAERQRFPSLLPVIQWLENGGDPQEAVRELRAYQQMVHGPNVEAKAQTRQRLSP